MRSFKFPKMFKSNSSRIWREDEYNEATRQNVLILLQSERGELECDPYFGILLKHYLFNQNSYILKDILIDTIYTQIAIFLPQVKVSRNDIDIIADPLKGRLHCTFSGVNQIDYTHNTFNLVLFDESRQLA
jgi:phage baseplate assembly protein W